MANVSESTKVDGTVVLPKQLRDQMAASEAIRNDFGKSNEPIEEATVISTTPAPTPGEEQPKVTPPSAVAPQAPTPAPVPTEDASWEQRHRSLQGRYDTLQRNYEQQGSRISDLERLITTMQAAQPISPDQNPANLARTRLLSDEEEEEYGADMLTVVGKKAREEITPEIEELRGQVKELTNRLNGVGTVLAKDKQQQMFMDLDKEIPGWEAQNTDDGYLAWLAQPDPYSGRLRQEMLTEAFTRQDTKRVIQFFKGFNAEASGLPQNPSSPGTEAPPLNNGSGRPSLEDFAAPGRARSAPQSQLTPDKPMYTTAQIQKFYLDQRTGKYKGREADAQAIEADIFAAGIEGRIIQ